ncbi:hypothetical protein QYM36_018328 [Artemia franciscana]|uniref:Uncharacterized protein n=1 Tax=Artemia franciscana TaxID=6661 RepID=A0AA88HD69_ARTSF|nr:hypothetical protein QYM36_018328 [Artemia franciscana]
MKELVGIIQGSVLETTQITVPDLIELNKETSQIAITIIHQEPKKLTSNQRLSGLKEPGKLVKFACTLTFVESYLHEISLDRTSFDRKHHNSFTYEVVKLARELISLGLYSFEKLLVLARILVAILDGTKTTEEVTEDLGQLKDKNTDRYEDLYDSPPYKSKRFYNKEKDYRKNKTFEEDISFDGKDRNSLTYEVVKLARELISLGLYSFEKLLVLATILVAILDGTKTNEEVAEDLGQLKDKNTDRYEDLYDSPSYKSKGFYNKEKDYRKK